MINIYNIANGWAILQIGCCHFIASYLTDIMEDINDLLKLKDKERSVKRVILQGETHGDLSLTAYLTFGSLLPWANIEETNKIRSSETDEYGDIINIIWQRLYSPEGETTVAIRFPYKKFKEDWKTLCKNIKEDYDKNFLGVTNNEEL